MNLHEQYPESIFSLATSPYLVHQAVMEDIEDLSSFEVYSCGSLDMNAVAKCDFLEQGLLEKNFFADAFTVFK